MNILVIGRRAGQCATSTTSLMLGSLLAQENKRVLYAPIASEMDDIVHWLQMAKEKSPTTSISQIYALKDGGSISPSDIFTISQRIMQGLYLVDFRNTTLDFDKFLSVIQYITEVHSGATASSDRYDVVIYDFHYDGRSFKLKDTLMKSADIIIETTSNNTSLYTENDWLDAEYRAKTIQVGTQTLDRVNSFIEKFYQLVGKSQPIIVFDEEIIKSQNNGEFKKYLTNMLKDPDVRQQHIRNSLIYLNKLIQRSGLV